MLFCGEREISLPPKAADTLSCLVENAPNVVDKKELLKRVWQDAFVEEGSLTRTIFVLRKALGDGKGGRQYIATISRRGYRFVELVRQVSSPATGRGSKQMMAVLPFENLSADKKQEYFSDGLSEEMITELGRLNPERMGVIARTSAMQYKRTAKTIQQIGQELGVSYVLEGSVRKAGGRVRITAQLIQVSDQTHLWAETYERDMGNILTLQGEVAGAIAKQIEIRLAPKQQARLSSARAINPEAFEAYLKGRYLWNKRTEQALRTSVRHFEKAIQLEPGYAAAYAGLADSYLTLHDDGLIAPEEAFAQAKALAGKALAIDESMAEAHISVAHASFHEFKWRDAEIGFRRGIQLNPNYAVAHFYYANYLICAGRTDEAIAEAQRAQTLDPVSLIAEANVAGIFYHAHQYDAVIEHARKVLETDPEFAKAHDDLGRAYEQKGMHDLAIAAFQTAVELSGRSPGYLASLAHGCALAGRTKKALGLLRELKTESKKKFVPAYAFAVVYAGLGNNDQALAWLAKAYKERSSAVPFINVNPRFSSLQTNARFQRLLRNLGLPS